MSGLRTKSSIDTLKAKGVVVPKDPPRKLQSLTDLTEAQRGALLRASTQGVLPGVGGIHPATVKALAGKGLVHERTSKKGRTSWRATDTGRYLVAVDVQVFLHRRLHRNYTNDPTHAVRGEESCMHDIDDGVLAPPAPKKSESEGTLKESIKAMKARQAQRPAA